MRPYIPGVLRVRPRTDADAVRACPADLGGWPVHLTGSPGPAGHDGPISKPDRRPLGGSHHWAIRNTYTSAAQTPPGKATGLLQAYSMGWAAVAGSAVGGSVSGPAAGR